MERQERLWGCVPRAALCGGGDDDRTSVNQLSACQVDSEVEALETYCSQERGIITIAEYDDDRSHSFGNLQKRPADVAHDDSSISGLKSLLPFDRNAGALEERPRYSAPVSTMTPPSSRHES